MVAALAIFISLLNRNLSNKLKETSVLETSTNEKELKEQRHESRGKHPVHPIITVVPLCPSRPMSSHPRLVAASAM
jgi:hypothetical protein